MRIAITVVMLWVAASAGASPIFVETFTGFRATGLAPQGAGGALDSLRWRLTGLSEGDSSLGERRAGGDFGRGRSSGGVRTGGVYAFEVEPGDLALGLQPSASDLTPGGLELHLGLAPRRAARALEIAYRSYVYNDTGRATRLELAWERPDRRGAHRLAAATRLTPGAALAIPQWVARDHALEIAAPALAGAAELVLRWTLADAGGSGGRDELALDDLRIAWAGATVAVPEPAPGWLLGAALGLLVSRSRRALGRSRASSRRRSTASR